MSDTICCGCGNPGLEIVLSLGKLPLANRLLTFDQLSEPEPRYPLDLAFCASCSLVQLTEIVPPEEMFGEYAYFSSWSTTAVAEAKKLATRMTLDRHLGPDNLVIEIASNDGYLLQHYVDAGIPVLGVDPARNVVEAAESRGVRTVCAFFGAEVAEELKTSWGRADVLHANNVIAHVPNLPDFLQGISNILAENGIAIIETPYVRELVDRVEFDTIYHEHIFYYSLTALHKILRRFGLRIVDVKRIPIHGGSLRVFIGHGKGESGASVQSLLAEENRIGLTSIDYFRGFAQDVEALKLELVRFLEQLKDKGRRIAAYGAAAKGAVLLNVCNIGRETLDFVVDRSTYKQGRYMPGVHLPIAAPERLLEEIPDDVLLLAWNLAQEIVDQQSEYLRLGGRFLTPIPHPRVMEPT